MSELVLMCGVPRSGKSTIAKNMATDYGHLVVCPDQIRSLIFGCQFRKEIESLVWFIAETMVKIALSQDLDVILDATNTTEKAVHKWATFADDLNADVTLLVVDTPEEEIATRNKGHGSVPPDVLKRMIDQFTILKNECLYKFKSEGITVEVISGTS